MLPLDSKEWAKLTHAYGPATDTPRLIADLATYPDHATYKDEPYFSLWSSLCHQGDIYSASYAAVPHIVDLAERATHRISHDFILLPVCIEIARGTKRKAEIPTALVDSYNNAILKLPGVAISFAKHTDGSWADVCSAAVAVSMGNYKLGKAILELNDDDALDDFLLWQEER